MIQAVIFDLDDTLYDEVDYCRSGFKAVAHFLDEVLGRGRSTTFCQTLWDVFQGGSRTAPFQVALERLGIPADRALIRSLIRVYRNHKPNLRLPQTSRQILRDLRPTYRLALLTDGYLPAQRRKVQALGLAEQVGPVLYTEQLGRAYWKPSTVGFERLLALLECPPEAAVYVADNPAKDFLGPNRLGMGSVQIQRPAALHARIQPPPQGSPQHQIDDLGDLLSLLPTLGSCPCPA